MTCSDWIRVLRRQAEDDDKVLARLDNLLCEDRIGIDEFRAKAGDEYRRRLETGDTESDAALATMMALTESLADPANPWLGGIGADVPAGVSALVTHTGASDHAYRDPYAPRPGASVWALGVGKANRDRTVRSRFVWVSFRDPAGNEVSPDDPEAIARELGLAHLTDSEGIYRFVLSLPNSGRCWVPTALDARLYEAWRRPPPDHAEPWGLTRDLTTGERRWPEILVETADYLFEVEGTLVRRADGSSTVGPIAVDFRIGRELPA